MKYYIAYGSNLNVGQMKYRCPGAKIVGTAILEGWELLFKGSKTGSYLTIEESANSRVPVAVWAVTEADEKALDRYEGYPVFYYKRELIVNMDNGREVDAFVYIMHEDRPIGVPSHYYVDACLEGYKRFKFDGSYLYEAYRKSKEAVA